MKAIESGKGTGGSTIFLRIDACLLRNLSYHSNINSKIPKLNCSSSIVLLFPLPLLHPQPWLKLLLSFTHYIIMSTI